MNQPLRSEKALQKIPATWGLVLVSLLIVYVLLQPWANRTFGWNLPALASSSEPEPGNRSKESIPPAAENRTNKSEEEKSHSEGIEVSQKGGSSEDPQSREVAPRPRVIAADQTASENQETSNRSEKTLPSNSKKFDFLEEIGPNRFRSPVGLTYGPGSEEGHRLKHLERHLSDQPDRLGKHGVFDGDMTTVLRWIDEAYQRSQKKAKGTTLRDENGRTVIEASFDTPIGYIGGRDGKRSKNPKSKRLRLVLDGKAVITAFPF